MRRATEAERAEQIDRHKDAPIVVSVRPCIDDEGWNWSVRGPFAGQSGYCTYEDAAREMAERARAEVEADPATYNPPVIWMPEDDDFD